MNTKPVYGDEDVVDLSMTPTDISAELRRSNPARQVYQPAQEWVEVGYGRRMFYFPPDLPNEPLVAHPCYREDGKPVMVRANGTLEVHDSFGPILERTPDGLRMKRGGAAFPIPGEAADDFLKFVGASDKYRKCGFTWLRGDGKDEQRKVAARKIYQLARRQWAEQEIQSRAEAIANFNKLPQNQGQTPPPPTANQIEAQEFMDELKASGRKGSEFICRHGCYETNDFNKYQRHMKVNHEEAVTQEAAPSEPAATKRAPGRPRKVEAVA